MLFERVKGKRYGAGGGYPGRRCPPRRMAERERIKLAALATTLVEGLRGRGAGDAAASLAAEMGIAVFRLSFERWIESDDGRTLAKTMREYFHELKLVSAGKHA